VAFHPYLFFVGDCRAAFTRYHEILGGDLTILDSQDAPDGQAHAHGLVMHAALALGDGVLMGSDDPTATERTPVTGIVVSYTAPDAEETRRIVSALAEGGGTVDQEPIETFFSPAFGLVTDPFGVPWMVSALPADA